MVMKWVELGLHLIWASRKRPKGFCVENQNPRSYGQKHVIKQSEQTLSRCLHVHPPFLHRPPLCSQPRPGQNGECLSNSQIFVLINIWFRFVLFSSVWIWIISILCSLSSGTWRSGESLSSTTAKNTAGSSS